MISISVSDLLILPEFAGYSEWDIVEKKEDKKVLDACFNLGLDKNKGYCYDYNIHRNLQNKVVEGFRIVGEIRIDKEFRKSPFCTLIDKIIMHSVTDVGFAMDLASRMGSTLNYAKFQEDDERSPTDGFDKDLLEPNYSVVEKRINSMVKLLSDLRGTPINDSGLLKTYEEWMGKRLVV